MLNVQSHARIKYGLEQHCRLYFKAYNGAISNICEHENGIKCDNVPRVE